ncbi:MAG TPA: hypothetical protein VFE19_05505 [Jatrophihabitantaceae bacterium]|nr:hypothetical protein [Jatrophihabitantaceae bacterium]
MNQFSLFGAAAAEPSRADLDGVLLAGGHWVRNAGTARLSIVVAQRWRADALAAEFAMRAVEGPDPIVAAEEGWSVRTGFRPELLDAAARWTRGANEGPPTGFALTVGGLRLWAIAWGRHDEGGYLLATSRVDPGLHLAAGAQLSRLGLAAVSIGARGGPGWRITSAKRLRRFAELVGPAPDGGGSDWL